MTGTCLGTWFAGGGVVKAMPTLPSNGELVLIYQSEVVNSDNNKVSILISAQTKNKYSISSSVGTR